MSPTSFWAANACSTSDISRLFSRSRVAGVRWSSSRSGILLAKKDNNKWSFKNFKNTAQNFMNFNTCQTNFGTYTRILSSKVVRKYSSRLTVILKRFLCPKNSVLYFFALCCNQDGGVALPWKCSHQRVVLWVTDLGDVPEIWAFAWKWRQIAMFWRRKPLQKFLQILLWSHSGFNSFCLVLIRVCSMSSVTLWVKPDAFDFGAIHAPLPSKLTFHVSWIIKQNTSPIQFCERIFQLF